MATHRRLQRTNQKSRMGHLPSRSLSNGRHMRDEMARPTSNQQQQRKRRLVSGKKRRSTDDNEDNDSRNGTSTLRNQQQQQQRNRRRPSLPTNEITYIVDDDDDDDDDDNENDEITRNVSARRHSNTPVASHGKTKGTKPTSKSNLKTIGKRRNDARDAWDDEEVLDCGGPEFAPASPTDPFDQIQLPPLSPPSYSPPSYSPPVRPVTASAPRTTTILPQFMPQTFVPQPRFYPPFQASTFFPTHPQIPFSQFAPQPSVPVTTPLSTSTPNYFQGMIRPTITPPAFVPAQRPAPDPVVLHRRRRPLSSTVPRPHLTTAPSQHHRSPSKSKRLSSLNDCVETPPPSPPPPQSRRRLACIWSRTHVRKRELGGCTCRDGDNEKGRRRHPEPGDIVRVLWEDRNEVHRAELGAMIRGATWMFEAIYHDGHEVQEDMNNVFWRFDECECKAPWYEPGDIGDDERDEEDESFVMKTRKKRRKTN